MTEHHLAEDMKTWEVHALRGLVMVLLANVQLYARSHPEAAELALSLLEAKDAHLLNQAAELKARRDGIEALSR